MMISRSRHGFTLIELLVVVAIIALLIAILLPSFAKARERARLAVCQSHLRAWAQGFHEYAAEWDGALPEDGGDGTWGAKNQSNVPLCAWNDSRMWFNGVTAYMGTGEQTYDQLQLAAVAKSNKYLLPRGGDNSIFVCPDVTDLWVDPRNPTGDVIDNGFFLTAGYYGKPPAAIMEQRPMLICYGMNSQLRVGFSYDLATYGVQTPTSEDILKLNALTNPSVTALIAEKRMRQDELPPNHPSYVKAMTQNKVTANRFAARHNKGGNIAFADGHVEWLLNASVDNPHATKAQDYNQPNVVIWNPRLVN